MAKSVVLHAQMRERAGKGAARAVGREGRVPAVLYGDKKESLMVSLNPKELHRYLTQPGFFTQTFDITIDGDAHMALARDVQFHPVTDVPLHVDFMRLSKGATVNVNVTVTFINEEASPGLKRGGVINVVRHDVELVCPVESIPSVLTIDLSGSDIGDSIHISEIELPEGVTPTITDRDFTVATIAAPSTMQITEDEGEGEGAEFEDGEEEEEEAEE